MIDCNVCKNLKQCSVPFKHLGGLHICSDFGKESSGIFRDEFNEESSGLFRNGEYVKYE